MGHRGPEPLHDKREAYARLIAEGIPSVRACRMVGINPRTGKRWRNGRRIITSQALGVPRPGDREGRLEAVAPLGADGPPELLDQVVPVEQLDRVREAAFPDPADAGRAVGHEADPVGLVDPEPRAQRGEALGKGGPGLGAGIEGAARQGPPIPAGPPRPVEHEADLDLELGAGRAVAWRRAACTARVTSVGSIPIQPARVRA